jgi:hypothetical protein
VSCVRHAAQVAVFDPTQRIVHISPPRRRVAFRACLHAWLLSMSARCGRTSRGRAWTSLAVDRLANAEDTQGARPWPSSKHSTIGCR